MSRQLNSILSNLKLFDAYPKTLDDFRVKTYTGASVTLISGILMLFLFLLEFRYFLETKVTQELLVDMSHNNQFEINLNISFPNLPCPFLSLDLSDVSGQRKTNWKSTILKQRFSQKDGSVLKDMEIQHNKSTESCYSCYGAESLDLMCCNTCADVKEAYRRKGWAIPTDGSVFQCNSTNIEVEKLIEEGCHIIGKLRVNKITGHLHVSPGKSYEVGNMHVHDVSNFNQKDINVTHNIGLFVFGNSYPGQQNPLDGWNAIASQNNMCFQYYVKVVPTVYTKVSGETIEAYQYSVTQHQKAVEESEKSSVMPGLFVTYEFSPLMIHYVEYHHSFLRFMTSLCAIIGGIFTVAGLVDAFIYNSYGIFKKINLGKFT